jgi:hypothetical protein
MKNKCISLLCFVLGGCLFVTNEPPDCDSDEVSEIIKKIVTEKTYINKMCINTKKHLEIYKIYYPELYNWPSSNSGHEVTLQYIPLISGSDCIIDNSIFQNTKERIESEIRDACEKLLYITECFYTDFSKKIISKNNTLLYGVYTTHLKSAENWVLISDIKSTILSISSTMTGEDEWLKYPETKDSTDRGSGYRKCRIDAVVENNSQTENFKQEQNIVFSIELYGKDSEGNYSYSFTGPSKIIRNKLQQGDFYEIKRSSR